MGAEGRSWRSVAAALDVPVSIVRGLLPSLPVFRLAGRCALKPAPSSVAAQCERGIERGGTAGRDKRGYGRNGDQCEQQPSRDGWIAWNDIV
jgi:hypothetical protein